ncbi:craniofacial development protein 2-like [Plakobranchus ocellatus]|uniref:Craniofacial development protein 2-like n=1 Tax=Plakobranchus ocellatus TaxID=259542 RepID=A0AAV3Y2Y4_9GAST|nr:craniofacial development protein 2-like [Plakobranchus ocellatus]
MKRRAAKIVLELVDSSLRRANCRGNPPSKGTALVEGSQATTSIIAKQIMVYTKNKYKANDVKGWPAINRPVSSGRGSHVPQVTLDCNLVTACKTTTTTTKTATWNVRTMLQKGKLDNIKREMERMKINILGLSEVRWQGAGVITSGNYKIFYSGGTTHERGVGIILDKEIGKAVKGYWTLSDRIILLKIAGKPLDINIIQVYAPTSACSDDDIEKFYEELEEAKTQCS